jgi:hypothetical protein
MLGAVLEVAEGRSLGDYTRALSFYRRELLAIADRILP